MRAQGLWEEGKRVSDEADSSWWWVSWEGVLRPWLEQRQLLERPQHWRSVGQPCTGQAGWTGDQNQASDHHRRLQGQQGQERGGTVFGRE